jgi:UDP-N-acetylmuramoyl-tripeptide--D-alanyl-D-alanine ligase
MEVTQRPDGVTVINDAYNASPEAMAAAIDTLAVMARGRRSFAVLGPMYELGRRSRAIHEEMGGRAARAGVAGLIVVGEDAAPILAGAKAEGSWHGELLWVPDVGARSRRPPPASPPATWSWSRRPTRPGWNGSRWR